LADSLDPRSSTALFPGSAQLFSACSTEKQGEPWYPFSREHDIINKWPKIQDKVSCIIFIFIFLLYPNFNTRQKSGIWVCQIAKYMLIQGLPQKQKKSKYRETYLIHISNNMGLKGNS